MDFQAKLRILGISKAGLGKVLGVHRNTVSRWKEDCPGYAHAYLDLMIEYQRYRDRWAGAVKDLNQWLS